MITLSRVALRLKCILIQWTLDQQERDLPAISWTKKLYLDSLILGILKLETKMISSLPTSYGSVYTYFLSAELVI